MDFIKSLYSWYDKNHRDLPWRRTKDPYKIWISEIILQQTRIAQGLGYYKNFIRKFRTIKELALADEREVLKCWQGLGYYSRARNLYDSAKDIVKNHKGKFPSDYDDIRKLKGIGDYTAAAIASIAFSDPYPVIDGNVLRFFSRCFGITDPVDKSAGRKTVQKIAADLIDKKNPGKFNQAIMEFGALQCKAGKPDCGKCPFRKTCYAFSHDSVEELPFRTGEVKTRTRYFNYLVMTYRDPVKGILFFMRKRNEDDIWKNLWDFPVIETQKPTSLGSLMKLPEWQRKFKGKKFKVHERSRVYLHILTHQVIHARFVPIHLLGKPRHNLTPVSRNGLNDFPVPRLIDKYFEESFPLTNNK